MSAPVTHVIHPFAPLFDKDSRVLILGSLPSVASRKNSFYYGHPQNRFWKMLAAVFGEDIPQTIEEKTELCRRHHIALYDVIESCDIRGSSDASIRNAKPADLDQILSHCTIQTILCNGRSAFSLYTKHQQAKTGLEALCMPSTSPANAAWSLDRLIGEWKPAILHGLTDLSDED